MAIAGAWLHLTVMRQNAEHGVNPAIRFHRAAAIYASPSRDSGHSSRCRSSRRPGCGCSTRPR